jgi:N-acetylglucosaminyl-diphospho-decaprenol L-rhamnosyltransferase
LLLKIERPIPVFIVHWNRPSECVQTVRCFLERGLPLRISVVDNASDMAHFNFLQESLPVGVELIRLEENKGWGGGLNVPLRRWLEDAADDCGYCFIGAHDALPENGCLEMLLEAAQRDSTIGIVCPEYGSARDLPHYTPVRGPRLLPSPERPRGSVEAVDFAHATLLLARKSCLKEIGLFDERYFAYGDEYDIALKARRFGWKVAVVWGAIVVNPISATPRPTLSYLFARNTLLLALTYGGLGHAASRMLLMCLNTLRIYLKSSITKRDDYPGARLLGIRDFLLRRYGSPPLNLK